MADGIFELLKKGRIGIDKGYVGKTGINSKQIEPDLFPV
jgi:hypothetical protein